MGIRTTGCGQPNYDSESVTQQVTAITLPDSRHRNASSFVPRGHVHRGIAPDRALDCQPPGGPVSGPQPIGPHSILGNHMDQKLNSVDPVRVAEFVRKIRERVGRVVVGQDVVVERTLIALFTGGHLLLQGVPGLAKTLLVSVLSRSIDLHFMRIQFTIDLLPSDILGSEILDQRTSEFRTRKGPIFTNLLLADEINRAAPKVQGDAGSHAGTQGHDRR